MGRKREKEIEFPKVITSGQSKATIYKLKIADKDRFQIRWWEFGKVQRQTTSELDGAIFAAQAIADRLRSGELAAINLEPMEAATYRNAIEACGGTPLDAVCREWKEAKRRLGKTPLMQAVDDWVLRNAGNSIPLNECVDLFFSEQDKRGNHSEYVRIAKARLELVKTAFGSRSIADITAGEIREFIEGRGGAKKTKKNFRDIIVGLWRWARSEGYLPRDIQTEAERVPAIKIKSDGPIEIFTPEEMTRMLAKCEEDLLPVLAICGFAGVRSGTYGEISRLKWENVRFQQGIIEVVAPKANGRRIVPIQPNLAAWLDNYKDHIGPIWTGGMIEKAFERLSESSGVEWRYNGLRHSYGSYRVAITKNIHQTSLEMGNSPEMIQRHYLEHVHEDEAEKWFAVMPK